MTAGPTKTRRPRILVTGFNAFPGAPVNPTETLIRSLESDGAPLCDQGAVSFAVLDVDYRSLGPRLEDIAEHTAPDIAIHFGLSARASGFTLERRGVNRVGRSKGDNGGFIPESPLVLAGGPDTVAGTLPYEAIGLALERLGLPWSLSDDAGDYLCNYLLYTACGSLCTGFRPAMAGFVHVPPTGAGMPLTDDQLVAGARAIIAATMSAWYTSAATARAQTT